MATHLRQITPVMDLIDVTDPDFRRVIDMHIPWIRRHPSTQVVALDAYQGYKNEGDFYSLLADQQIPFDLYWITRRVNGVGRLGAISEELGQLMIPDRQLIANIHSRWQQRIQKNRRNVGDR